MDQISKALERAKSERRSVRGWVSPQPARAAGSSFVDSARNRAFPELRVEALDTEVMAAGNMLTDRDVDNPVLADHFRQLRTRVLHKMKASNWSRLGITSATAKAGKSYTAINLATTLARANHENVILVDCDVRNPSVANGVGVEVEKGLIDCLAGEVSLEDVMFACDHLPNLKILPGRVDVEEGARLELFTESRLNELFQVLHGMGPAATTIIDLPPVLVGDEVLSIAPFVDAFMMIVRDGETQIDKLNNAMGLLKDFEIIGTVLNDSNESLKDYAGYAYGAKSS